MRITLRLIFWLIAASAVVVAAFTHSQVQEERTRLEAELRRGSSLLADSFQSTAEALLQSQRADRAQRWAEQFGNRAHLTGVALYTADGQPLAMATSLAAQFQEMPPIANEAMAAEAGRAAFTVLADQRRWYLRALPLRLDDGRVAGAVLLAYDTTYITDRSVQLWRDDFPRLVLHVLLIAVIALFLIRWSLLRPIAKTVKWLERLRTGEAAGRGPLPRGELFGPLSREVAHLAKSLRRARSAAEEEARLRNAAESRWTPDRLKEHVRSLLQGRPLLVVSNREPYVHVRQNRQIHCLVPPAGLVTAMEPILRACSGTWVAHGGGDADRETADAQGRLRVPPDDPRYTLRRVWLEPEEERGYYYGFANEGLWPLCHIAHTRPIFRAEDWGHYARVNATFAAVVLEELARTESPCVLIQDYHFALLPRLVKAQRPDAKVALFWHIPWPNPEAFAICPWARELLDGMLGADLLGFHTQFHCNNFLDTVDRMLESRIDAAQFAINRADHTTWVKPFPISIAEADGGTEAAAAPASREETLKAIGVTAQRVAVGVDRLDYTKGIVERLLAVERFLEQSPEFLERFTFVELGAPSRTAIHSYQALAAQLDAEVERINRRFQTRAWKPIVFLKKQHTHDEIHRLYRAADLCLVTSLHDGMNLVSKEFVAARTDERGVLILSQFTGASRELQDALIVNPYDIDQVAAAIRTGLAMPPEEQQARMARLRSVIQEHNVYRWAATLITELARLRPDAPQPPAPTALEA